MTYSTPGHNLGRGAPTELVEVVGSVQWVYRSQNPADRPSVDDILREIDKHS